MNSFSLLNVHVFILEKSLHIHVHVHAYMYVKLSHPNFHVIVNGNRIYIIHVCNYIQCSSAQDIQNEHPKWLVLVHCTLYMYMYIYQCSTQDIQSDGQIATMHLVLFIHVRTYMYLILSQYPIYMYMYYAQERWLIHLSGG